MNNTRGHVEPSDSFAPGTFAPNPRRATVQRMLVSQGFVEAKLFLRHGEQALLSFIIPIGALLAIYFLPLIDDADPVSTSLPLMLAIAAMSSGFTGQSISLAFDRRYGALKRTGASGVPAWTIIVGKIIGVVTVSVLQFVLLTGLSFILGWRVSILSFFGGWLVFLVGVAAFTSLGMLLGGTFSSELVLGVANLIWVAFVGAAAFVLFRVEGDPSLVTQLIPSVALAEGLDVALNGAVPLCQIAILAGWLAIGGIAATKWFRFN